MAVSVDVFVKDDSLANAPIQSVILAVYDLPAMTLAAMAVSDVNGKAAFLLPGSASPGTEYEIRMYKPGVMFSNPFRIQVVEPVITTNKFDVQGTLLTLPVSTDPRVCRCTGRFVGLGNSPIPNVSFRVSSLVDSGTQTPKVVDGNMVSPDTVVYTSDSDGTVSIDLQRTGQYYVTFSGEEDVVWPITVPDRSSVNLIDLIHPMPVQLKWDATDAPGNSATVQAGQFKEVKYTVVMSDYREIGSGNGLSTVIQIMNNDPTVMDVAAGDALIVIFGKESGSGSVTAELTSTLTPVTVPAPVLTLTDLAVTVTP